MADHHSPAELLRYLASRFERLDSALPAAAVAACEIVYLNQAGRAIAAAVAGGLLAEPFSSLVAWHRGELNEHPRGRIPGFSRCDVNLFGDAVAELVPAVLGPGRQLLLATIDAARGGRATDSEAMRQAWAREGTAAAAWACRRLAELIDAQGTAPVDPASPIAASRFYAMLALDPRTIRGLIKTAGVAGPGRGGASHPIALPDVQRILAVGRASPIRRVRDCCQRAAEMLIQTDA